MKPIRIFLFILLTLAVLAVVCWLLPTKSYIAGNELRSPQLREVLEIEDALPTDTVAAESVDTIAAEPVLRDTIVRDTVVAKPKPQQRPKRVVPVVEEEEDTAADTIDTHIYLTRFYAALQGADTAVVRVVHYGDSQVEGDRITMMVRRALQGRYGGGGAGLVPLHQTIHMRTVTHTLTMNGATQSAGQGPKRYLVYGPKSNRREGNLYGPMGQVAVMNTALVKGSDSLTLHLSTTKESIGERYYNRLRVLRSAGVQAKVGQHQVPLNGTLTLPDSTSKVTLQLCGQGDVYGISMESDKGVVVDNIPMRGCAGTIFTGIAAEQLQTFFDATQTRLIILQYGGNVVPYTKTKMDVRKYIERIRRQVQYLKRCAPEADILFIGPSDMVQRDGGNIQTYPMVPVMDTMLQRLAVDEQIGYYSLFRAMGGREGMQRWREAGLAGSDYIHFTRRGADKAGEQLAEWLMNE